VTHGRAAAVLSRLVGLDTLDGRHLERARKVVDDGVEEGLYALVL